MLFSKLKNEIFPLINDKDMTNITFYLFSNKNFSTLFWSLPSRSKSNIFVFFCGHSKCGAISNRGIKTNFLKYNLGWGITKLKSLKTKLSKNKISKHYWNEDNPNDKLPTKLK